jgi:hypothetical protein
MAERKYLTHAQKAFIEKWGKSRNWHRFKMSALVDREIITGARLRDTWGFLRPSDTSSDNFTDWYFEWTDAAKEYEPPVRKPKKIIVKPEKKPPKVVR